jgi:hypothetical protein
MLNSREPKPFESESGILQFPAEVKCTLLGRRCGNHAKIRDTVPLPMLALSMIRMERVHGLSLGIGSLFVPVNSAKSGRRTKNPAFQIRSS